MTFVFTGLLALIPGLIKWSKRQVIRDTHDDLQNKKLEIECRKAMPNEIEDNLKQEEASIALLDQCEQSSIYNEDRSFILRDRIKKIQQIEEMFIHSIGNCYGPLKLHSGYKIGPVIVDLLLDINLNKRVIIEISYSDNPDTLLVRLRRMMESLSIAKQNLEKMNESPEYFLRAIIVVNFDNENLLNAAKNLVKTSNAFSEVRFVTFNQLDELYGDCEFVVNLIEN